jgi:hypothetical protein
MSTEVPWLWQLSTCALAVGTLFERKSGMNVVVDEEAILTYALHIGFDPVLDREHVIMGLSAELEPPWQSSHDDKGNIYYFRNRSGGRAPLVQWEHPSDDAYRKLAVQLRRRREIEEWEKNKQRVKEMKPKVKPLLLALKTSRKVINEFHSKNNIAVNKYVVPHGTESFKNDDESPKESWVQCNQSYAYKRHQRYRDLVGADVSEDDLQLVKLQSFSTVKLEELERMFVDFIASQNERLVHLLETNDNLQVEVEHLKKEGEKLTKHLLKKYDKA